MDSIKKGSNGPGAVGLALEPPDQAKNANQPPHGAELFFPPGLVRSLTQLREAARGCKGCDLYRNATQTVFGEGARKAAVMLIGEQPGDREDIAGKPFVGPAGALLDRALSEAGVDRGAAYVTNAVKHFKWTPAPRGKRRLHARPNSREIQACRPWLEEEIRIIRPRVLVLLGATAAQSLMGGSFRITKERGRVIDDARWGCKIVATMHPSAILRAPDEAQRAKQFAELVEDLRTVAGAAAG